MAVLGDVRADEPRLAVADLAVRSLEVRLALAQRLDLGPDERDARLDAVGEVVVVPGSAVVDDQLVGHAAIVAQTAELTRSVSQSRTWSRNRGSIAWGSGYSA